MHSGHLPDRIRHVILDRDGVINEEAPGGYILSAEQWRWIPGSVEAMAILFRAGIAISVATNQSCVGRGLISEAGLRKINEIMTRQTAEHGITLAGIFYCPHAPGQGCRCRKPGPGLLEEAIGKTGISRSQTVFIGDAARDLQAAAAAGIHPLLVRTGKGGDTEIDLQNGTISGVNQECVWIFDDLLSASRAITAEKGNKAE